MSIVMNLPRPPKPPPPTRFARTWTLRLLTPDAGHAVFALVAEAHRRGLALTLGGEGASRWLGGLLDDRERDVVSAALLALEGRVEVEGVRG